MTFKLAYFAREEVVRPHPRAHALDAAKRNITVLCDEPLLRETGVADNEISTLLATISRTEMMTGGNRAALRARRRARFFKPAIGYRNAATSVQRDYCLTITVSAEEGRNTCLILSI